MPLTFRLIDWFSREISIDVEGFWDDADEAIDEDVPFIFIDAPMM